MPASNFCRAEVFLQPLCSGSWTEISQLGASVAVDGGEFDIGEVKVFGADYPVVAVGKPGRINVTVRALYTEVVSEAYELVKTAYETFCDHALCLRWIPLGSTVGNKVFTTVSGILTNPVYPGGEAATPDPTTIEFTVTCQRIDESNVV